jgi:hypothetical protein
MARESSRHWQALGPTEVVETLCSTSILVRPSSWLTSKTQRAVATNKLKLGSEDCCLLVLAF